MARTQAPTLDTDAIGDMALDINVFDEAVRKALSMPANIEDPVRLIANLAGLARSASSAVQAIAGIMKAAQREQEIESLRRQAAKEN